MKYWVTYIDITVNNIDWLRNYFDNTLNTTIKEVAEKSEVFYFFQEDVTIEDTMKKIMQQVKLLF
ncbi:hypothetical protein BHF71_07150 [Vulcanibacillus modesticaldus]|uniref:Uncharacterized protein n=1 Tax=Vulcanibacillus modesticaldus TaxID=337097 RepID=A0A1D2YWF2_9BACI|nr:hypothetical protein [Vulcanibacillus modesticaldus]OEF99965.1 hypothetical protein BHF71_07150 [Vulcanibacillus modesticaldus]